jgi:tRNA(adenine34) deaminase
MQNIDEIFMGEALSMAKEALLAGEFPVGCVFVHKNRVVARGSRVSSAGSSINEIDHAEIMALREFYTLPPTDPKEITVYCTLEPCLMCFAALAIAGVGKIVYAYEDAMGGGTGCRLETLSPFYRERQPAVVPHMLREESLNLFKAFFKNPETDYLKNTHLAAYTLSREEGEKR